MGYGRVFGAMLVAFATITCLAFLGSRSEFSQVQPSNGTADTAIPPDQTTTTRIEDPTQTVSPPESKAINQLGGQFGPSVESLGGMGAEGAMGPNGETFRKPHYKEVEAPSGEDIFKLLTSHVWTNWEPGQKSSPFCAVGEGESLFHFHANGLYERRQPTALDEGGRWNLQPGPYQRWLVCLDNGERHLVKVFENNIIQLDDLQFQYPKQRIEPRADAKDFKSMEPLTLSGTLLDLKSILTARTWYRANDVNTSMYPATIDFLDDYTYVARSINGRQYPTGIWQATTTSALARGPVDAEGEGDYLKNYGAHLPIKLEGRDQLIIAGTPYLPKERLSSQGVLWLTGHQHLRVRVEYQKPIRRGVACRFDVYFVNLPDLSLQRFSVTKNYDHSYRLPNKELGKVEELAAIDLGNTQTGVGESKSFTLNVTFPEAGNQLYYLNAMMAGTTQHWDMRNVVEFRVTDN